MPSLSLLIRNGEVCQCLRSKKLAYEDPYEPTEVANAAPFWCVRTQSILGPDGKVVDHEACRPGRECCETT